MKVKISYFILGIVLCLGLFATRVRGLDPETKKDIDRALAMGGEAFFPGFSLDRYPLDVSYGKIEFRYFKGKESKQRPEVPPAFSALMTDRGPVLKVLGEKEFRTIYDRGDASKKSLGRAYISTLFHEGFHCFQMEHGLEGQTEEALEKEDSKGTKDLQTFYELVKKLDNDPRYQELWKREMKGLVSFRDEGSRVAYDRAKRERETYLKGKLSKENFTIYKDYSREMELVEGSARFVENSVLDHFSQKRNGVFKGNYEKGTDKFYLSGSLKTEILKNRGRLGNLTFDQKQNLDDLME